ncbi:MAG TPA: HAD family hydrolase [Pyrinomonadaceae bacterium]
MIKAVIFDIDGTLVDSVDLHAQAWKEAFKHFGKDIPYQQIRHQIGKGGDQLMPVFFTPDERDEFGKRMEKFRGELFQREFLPRVRPFPGVRELFQRIKEDDKKIALASSAKDEEIEIYKKLLRIEDLVEAGASADDAEKSKPHPDIFRAALDRLDVRPAEAIAVGDTPYDADAAGRLRIKTIGMRCGGFPEAELIAAGCIAIYDDPADLLARYEESMLRQKEKV